MREAFQKELHFLGIESSPDFGRAPESNSCTERFIRTPKKLLWIWPFDALEELSEALVA